MAKPFYNSLSEEESIGMLFFSSFTSTYSLAEGSLSGSDSESVVERLLQSFQLIRGIRLLLAPHWRYLANSWAGPILQSNMAAGTEASIPTTPILSEQGEEHYRAVRALAHGLDDAEQRRACLKAHEDVFRYMQVLRGRAEDRVASNRLIMTWAVGVEPTFELLVRQKKPVALIISAEYAVLIRYGADLWWVSKWPGLLMKHIDRNLGANFDEFLAWPRGEIGQSL